MYTVLKWYPDKRRPLWRVLIARLMRAFVHPYGKASF